MCPIDAVRDILQTSWDWLVRLVKASVGHYSINCTSIPSHNTQIPFSASFDMGNGDVRPANTKTKMGWEDLGWTSPGYKKDAMWPRPLGEFITDTWLNYVASREKRQAEQLLVSRRPDNFTEPHQDFRVPKVRMFLVTRRYIMLWWSRATGIPASYNENSSLSRTSK